MQSVKSQGAAPKCVAKCCQGQKTGNLSLQIRRLTKQPVSVTNTEGQSGSTGGFFRHNCIMQSTCFAEILAAILLEQTELKNFQSSLQAQTGIQIQSWRQMFLLIL